MAIAYGYQDHPADTDPAPALQRSARRGLGRDDLRYLTNQDARGAHPRVHQWANGTDPARELERMLQVRRVALDRFGESAIPAGRPLATLEEALVPLYLHHRYQIDAAASALGGVDYVYAMRGDGRVPVTPVPGDRQRAALAALLRTLDPAELTLPETVLRQIPPRPPGHGLHRELFPRRTGPVFDALTPAIVAADLTVSQMLAPPRAARLVEQAHARRDAAGPGGGAGRADRRRAFDAPGETAYERAVRRAVQRVVVERTVDGARRAGADGRGACARDGGARTYQYARLPSARPKRCLQPSCCSDDIERFLDRPGGPVPSPAAFRAPAAPPGSPIGEPALDWLGAYPELLRVGLAAGILMLGDVPPAGGDPIYLRRSLLPNPQPGRAANP